MRKSTLFGEDKQFAAGNDKAKSVAQVVTPIGFLDSLTKLKLHTVIRALRVRQMPLWGREGSCTLRLLLSKLFCTQFTLL